MRGLDKFFLDLGVKMQFYYRVICNFIIFRVIINIFDFYERQGVCQPPIVAFVYISTHFWQDLQFSYRPHSNDFINPLTRKSENKMHFNMFEFIPFLLLQ